MTLPFRCPPRICSTAGAVPVPERLAGDRRRLHAAGREQALRLHDLGGVRMRAMFLGYAVVIAGGLAYFVAIAALGR